jgi:hypothetical protein
MARSSACCLLFVVFLDSVLACSISKGGKQTQGEDWSIPPSGAALESNGSCAVMGPSRLGKGRDLVGNALLTRPNARISGSRSTEIRRLCSPVDFKGIESRSESVETAAYDYCKIACGGHTMALKILVVFTQRPITIVQEIGSYCR